MTVVHVYGAYVADRTEGISANVAALCAAQGRAGAHVRQDCATTDLGRLNSRRALAASALHGARRVRAARQAPGTQLVHHHVSLLATALPSRLAGSRHAPVLVQAWNAHYEPGSAPGLPRADRLGHRLANGPEAARLALRGIGDLVVSSRHQARQANELGYDGRLHVVPNGVDLAAFRPRTAQEADNARATLGLTGDPVLLYYGHATPWKGLRDLVAALPAVLREHPRAQALLSLTGYGHDRAWLEAEVRRLGLADRVRTTGPGEVAVLHAAADLAVLPAPAGVGSACYPNVLLECMAGGVPVVATEVAGIPEVVQDGRTGLLATRGEPASLAARLSQLAGDPALRRRLAAQARQSMDAGFGWDAIALRMLAVYRTMGVDLVQRPRPSRPSRPSRASPSAPIPRTGEVMA
jgi:glycosyltransferase involved in cell wall biosynthesis